MNYDRNPRLNQHERLEQQKLRRERDTEGSGVYLYENSTLADLILPKPALDGKTTRVGGRKQFEGDSYFLSMVGPPLRLLRLVAEIEPAKSRTPPQTAETLTEAIDLKAEKLILDQPDTVTDDGTVEQVHQPAPPRSKVNETPVATKPAPNEVLLTEDPLDGVEIITG